MKVTKCKRSVFPYLAEVLNRSKFDGEQIKYSCRPLDNGKIEISFEKEIVGNYFHGRVKEAYNLKQEREAHCTMPILTKQVSQNKIARDKVLKKYGTKNYMVAE